MKMIGALLLICSLSRPTLASESFNLYQNTPCSFELSLPEGFGVRTPPPTQKGCGPITFLKKAEKDKTPKIVFRISAKTIELDELPDAFELSKDESAKMTETEIRDWLIKRSVFADCKTEGPDHFFTCPEMNIEIQTVNAQVPSFLRVTSAVADFGKLTKKKNTQYFWVQSVDKVQRQLNVLQLDPESGDKKSDSKFDVLKTTEKIGLSLRTSSLTPLNESLKKKIQELENFEQSSLK